MGVGSQHHAPAALPQGKTRYPLYRRLGGPQGWSERLRKISPPTGIRSRDCGIPALIHTHTHTHTHTYMACIGTTLQGPLEACRESEGYFVTG